MTSSIGVVKELSITDRTLISNLIDDGQSIVDISSSGSEWAEAVLAQRQNIRALLYASSDGERNARGRLGLEQAPESHAESLGASGLHLDEDAAAEGIPHIHYLHIGNMPMTRHVLRGARDLLATGRIDYVELCVDTHDFLTGQALMETLAERRYELFEIETDGHGETRLIRYLIFNPNRGRTVVSVLAIRDYLVRQSSLLLLQLSIQDGALQLPEPASSRRVV